ncbi:MAG: hypothetical protein OEN02_03540 [Gammaproteobacteria bacterium]|nr:hypothetical protein [Gammaproteobacteria bacterium]
MDIQRLLTSLSTRIIVQFGGVIAAAIILVALNFDLLYPFYFENQLTGVGITINSAIMGLLIIGLGSILYNLLRYRREEAAIARFVNNVEALKADLMEGIPADTIVAGRHATMHSIQNSNGEINHGALASMLNADESTRFGLIRFINNILILTGVFGTIVSLSIALLGASDLIDSADASLGGMGLVIQGMSTALSTTITAIVSYGIFGYFYTRLNDVQTHFLSGVEHLTSVYLMPKYVKSSDDIVHKMSDLIKSVIHATHNLKMTQEVYHDAAVTLQQTITANRQQIDNLTDELEGIKTILREGFRLPAVERES